MVAHTGFLTIARRVVPEPGVPRPARAPAEPPEPGDVAGPGDGDPDR
jgi:hypothetical protein